MTEQAPIVTPQGPGPQRSGCLVALAVVLGAGLAVSLLMNLVLVASHAPKSADRPPPLAQRWVAGEGEAKVLLVELSGIILDEVRTDGLFGASSRPVERIQRELEDAAADENVKAVLFHVDSPGGSVTASDQIWRALERFKERSKELSKDKKAKPLVVLMGGVCASGGYYVSAPADVIYAGPTTITGSIGVIMSTFNMSGLTEKFGVQNVTIKAGANKDLLNPFQPIREDHVKIIQGMIDEAYALFVKRIVSGRAKVGLDEAKVRELADGRIYTAEEAARVKLVDKIGYREEAFEEARKLAGLTEATLIRYRKQPNFFDALSGDVAAPRALRPTLDLSLEALLELETPRLMYVWSPGGR